MKEPVKGRPIVVSTLSRYIPNYRFWRMCRRIPFKYEKYLLNFLIIRYMARRPCEAVAINLSDIIYESQSIRMMMGKTNIITEVSVPDGLWQRLMIYIERNKHTFVNGYIFPAETSANNYLKVDTLSKYFRGLAKEEGLTMRIPGKKSHYMQHRFYDLVASGTTDITAISDTLQAQIARRHVDGRSIRAYQDVSRLTQERKIFNQIYGAFENQTEAIEKPESQAFYIKNSTTSMRIR